MKRNKWIVGLMVVMFVATSAVAKNSYVEQPTAGQPYSYMAQPKGSLFGSKKKVETEQTIEKSGNKSSPNQEKITTNERTPIVSNWGIGVRLGIAENNPKGMEDDYNDAFSIPGINRKKLSKENYIFGAEAFFELPTQIDEHRIGLKVGIEEYGKNKLDLNGTGRHYDSTEHTIAIPYTIYYRRNNGIKKWSWQVGAGVTWMNTKMKEVIAGFGIPDGKFSERKSKVFPHITAGVEYRFSQWFALGADLKYNISAKIQDEDGYVLADRSGLGLALMGRLYF